MSTPRPHLDALSARLGIVPVYHDLTGTERVASHDTRTALAAAMGCDASDEAAAERSCEALAREEGARLIEPVRVWREHDHGSLTLGVRAPESLGTIDAEIVLEEESGAVRRIEAAIPGSSGGRTVHLPVPGRPGAGYHRLRITIDRSRSRREETQRLIVAPRTARTAREVLGDRRCFGILANLYTVRSGTNWGFGSFSDLRELVRACGRWGGDFVALNPLHALRNRDNGIAPYSPVSRLYRNVLYIDVQAVPELADSAAARARLAMPELRAARERLRRAERIESEALADLALGVLRDLHRAFLERHLGRATPRAEAYARYLEHEGEALARFATFESLAAAFAADGKDWRRWPEPFRDPRSAAVAAFREEHAAEIGFHSWLQFEADRQLAQAAGDARRSELRIGILNDLAVGSPPDSADAWCFQGLFAPGVSVGAPPDAFAPSGQDWGFAPLDPRRLRADGYRLWSALLAASFRHAGALRIDHVMGLARLFWIPAGRPGTHGAYVRYPADELFGVLALESRRHGALVVGEDLGTVPAELSSILASWGILSTTVLLFEHDRGAFKPAARYSPRALVTATTHDIAPLAGYFEGRDLLLRRDAGRLGEEDLRAALAQRASERAGLVRRLEEDRAAGSAPISAKTGSAKTGSTKDIHRFLSTTPAPLLGLALDDVAGESEPINLPGLPIEEHRSWTRRMRTPIEDLELDPAEVGDRRRPSSNAT